MGKEDDDRDQAGAEGEDDDDDDDDEEEEEEAGCYMSPNQANHMPDRRLCALTG